MGKRKKYRIEASEIWIWKKKMEKIKRMDRVNKEEVLERIRVERTMIKEIIMRKASWLGQIIIVNGVLGTALEESVERVRVRGSRRLKVFDTIKLRDYRRDKNSWTQLWHNEPAIRQSIK